MISNLVNKSTELLGQLNNDLFPFSIIIPIALAIIVLLLLYDSYKYPGEKTNKKIKSFLVIIYLISGFRIIAFLFYGLDNILISGGGLIMWIYAGLLFQDIQNNKFRFEENFNFKKYPEVKIFGIFFMFCGIFLYPVIELNTGLIWPSIALFGDECPTTVFLIGLLIGAIPKIDKRILIIISLFAIATGFTFAINGFYVDYIYGISGLIGLYTVIRYKNDILKTQIL